VRTLFLTTAVPLIALALATGAGCSTTATKCLQTPASNKIPDDAFDTCESALDADLDRQDVFHVYMALLRVNEKYKEIEKWSKQVLAHDSGRTDALYNLAVALRKTGNCKAAVKKYRSYAKKKKDDPDPYFGMALCYEDLGDKEKAIQAYDTYIQRENREGQASWVDKAKQRRAILDGQSLAPAPTAKPAPAPAKGAPAAGAPPAEGGGPTAAAGPAGTPPPEATPPAAGAGGAAPPPEATPPAPPTPKPAPAAAAAPKAAPLSTDCSVYEKKFSSDPFNTEAYEKFAECASKAGRHSDVVARLRIGVRDNPDFHRGYLHLGRAFKALGQAGQAKSALEKACTAGVTEACN
jgi:tetratricopeptide (TPR) repeat protein